MTHHPPRVSVIIPAYNCARWLGQAIDSVLGQTLRDLELLVIDDGSTDATGEVARAYGDRLRYARQENRGPAAARNHGMRLARGELIAFLDADDLWLPAKLERQAALLDRDPRVGVVYCDGLFIDPDGRPIENYVRQTPLHRGRVAIELFCDHFLMTPAVVFRRVLLETAGAFDESLRVGEDYDFFLRLAAAAVTDVVEEKLWARRVVPDSLSRRDYVLDARTDLATLRRFIRRHPEIRAAHRERVRRRLADYHFAFGYRCLEEGRNGLALGQFLRALTHERSRRVFKNLALCALPYPLRRRFKESGDR
jgi:glycosyltransferase involved in cell wall biosynthesis